MHSTLSLSSVYAVVCVRVREWASERIIEIEPLLLVWNVNITDFLFYYRNNWPSYHHHHHRMRLAHQFTPHRILICSNVVIEFDTQSDVCVYILHRRRIWSAICGKSGSMKAKMTTTTMMMIANGMQDIDIKMWFFFSLFDEIANFCSFSLVIYFDWVGWLPSLWNGNFKLFTQRQSFCLHLI